MTHYCTACSSEFDDDSPVLPDADRVHCVFCGAPIPLPRSDARGAPTSVVPFSRDYEREEAFALGVINHGGPGFPDTLRQFRVPSGHPRADSLTPLAHGSERPSALPSGAPQRRWASLSLSLSVGFGVGVALAFAAVSLRPSPNAPHAATPAKAPSSGPARVTNPAPIVPPAPTNALATRPDPPRTVVAATAKLPTAEQDRRWLLDHARSEQRLYHISVAERMYRQILARAPRDSEALSGLGELDLLRGTVDLASAHFEQALEANANYMPALIAAADIRWQAGRVDEARQAYRDIVDHYSADLYPPYVALRSTEVATPVCER
jgi:hypothetical protein